MDQNWLKLEVCISLAFIASPTGIFGGPLGFGIFKRFGGLGLRVRDCPAVAELVVVVVVVVAAAVVAVADFATKPPSSTR